MLIISYDISNDKKRSKFNKYIKKYGHRLQYSVYEIKNSERILKIVLSDIEHVFSKNFDQKDSIIIIKTNPNCDIIKYGYAKNDEDDIIICE